MPQAATIEPRRLDPDLRGWDRARYLLRRGLATEAAGWRSIGRAIARRPRVPVGASPHPYDAPFRTPLFVFLGLSIIEVPIVDLLVHPWPFVRIPLLALGVWGVLTIAGMLLSYFTRPHAVGPAGIRVRSGGEVDIDLPWEIVACVERRRRSFPGAPALTLSGEEDQQALNHVAMDGTDIDIELERPLSLRLPQGEVTVAAVRLSVDDPAAFLDAVRTHIP